MNNLVNLDSKNDNSFDILNAVKGSKNDLNKFLSKSKEGGNTFFSMISSELGSISKLNKSVFDFLKVFEQNGVINKGYKKLSINKSSLLQNLENGEFLAKLKNMIKHLDGLGLDSLKSLKSELSLKEDLVNKKEVSKRIESLIKELNGVLNNINTFMALTMPNFNLDNVLKSEDQADGGQSRSKIKIEVKDFRKSGVAHDLESDPRSKIIETNSASKYKLKESSDDLFKGFTTELSNSEVKSSKADLKNINLSNNLRSEWDLKIARNIVEKAKVVLKSNDTGEIKLLLRPRNLGSIRINLNLDSANNLFGKIIVDNQNVRVLFEQNMHSLNKMFSENGFNTSLSLGLAGENAGSFSDSKDSEDKKKKNEFGFLSNLENSKVEEIVLLSSELEKSINLIV